MDFPGQSTSYVNLIQTNRAPTAAVKRQKPKKIVKRRSAKPAIKKQIKHKKVKSIRRKKR